MSASILRESKRRNLQSSRLAKVNELYDSQDVIKLYGISRNTLTNWINAGLTFIEGEQRLFLGADLNAFHRQRRIAVSSPCGPYEVYCVGCRSKHSLLHEKIDVRVTRTGDFRIALTCPEGSRTANRWVSEAELRTIRHLRESNPGPKTPD
ncbi:helix-turn-helix domain-containing protein [Sinorhizobium sp. BG8]|uniref:helix-turn-helix domain-containing protein n=1 Tax=Sinorhizobium sp. BG8 TaxID=2613773 RepID=UPI00193C970D|nr:helix-turn-helix domain-containing protein [Sinorhizobium sp. BG8]QRM53800.1 helix-turn-helix domain-containing protein [Sinorhizobium sp. BG8]